MCFNCRLVFTSHSNQDVHALPGLHCKGLQFLFVLQAFSLQCCREHHAYSDSAQVTDLAMTQHSTSSPDKTLRYDQVVVHLHCEASSIEFWSIWLNMSCSLRCLKHFRIHAAVTSSVNVREPVPLAARRAHTMTPPPPPCFTGGLFLSWSSANCCKGLFFTRERTLSVVHSLFLRTLNSWWGHTYLLSLWRVGFDFQPNDGLLHWDWQLWFHIDRRQQQQGLNSRPFACWFDDAIMRDEYAPVHHCPITLKKLDQRLQTPVILTLFICFGWTLHFKTSLPFL